MLVILKGEENGNIYVGIILIAIGIVAFTYQGIACTTREKVVDFGPIQMTVETTKTLPLSPIVGGSPSLGASYC